jgi:hypothetical protein
MKFIIDRLKEPSTYRGAVLLLTALGVSVNPELVAPITSAGIALAGLLGVFTKG